MAIALPARRVARKLGSRPFRVYYAAVALLMAIGFLLRGLHAYYANYSPISDMGAYLLFRERYFDLKVEDGTVLFPPGYPFFLQLMKITVGLTSLKPIFYVQALLDALAIGALAGIGRRLQNSRMGLIAAALGVVYHNSILYAALLLPESLCISFSIFCLFSFIQFRHHPSIFLALAIAVMGACATLMRSNTAVIIVILAAAVLVKPGSYRISLARSRIGYTLLILCVGLGLLLPWSVRNSRIADRPIFVSDNTGFSLAIANNPLSDGSYMNLEDLPDFHETIGKHQTIERYNQMAKYGKAYLKEQPLRFMFYLLPNKVDYLFTKNQWLWPWDLDVLGYNYSTHPFGPYWSFPLLKFSFLLPLGLIGMCIRTRHVPFLLPLLYLAFIVPLLLFLPSFRYRSSSDFLLLLSAAAVLSVTLSKGRFATTGIAAIFAWTTFAGAATLINCVRFNGPNVLEQAAISKTQAGKEMILGVFDYQHVPKQPNELTNIYIGDFHLAPSKNSHLLFTFDYSIETTHAITRRNTMNFNLTFFDETSKTVTRPVGPGTLLPREVELSSYQSIERTAWRVVPVPAYASIARLQFVTNFPGQFRVSRLSARGTTLLPGIDDANQ